WCWEMRFPPSWRWAASSRHRSHSAGCCRVRWASGWSRSRYSPPRWRSGGCRRCRCSRAGWRDAWPTCWHSISSSKTHTARVERVIPDHSSPAPESGGSTEYIYHHLHHLQVSVGDSQFMTLNVDTLFFTAVLSLLFVFFFIRSARKATAGVPGKFQTVVEIIVGFVDGLVRETFHGRSKSIAPLSLTIFVVVFLMNFIDLVPVDFLPWVWANGYVAAGHDPAHAYLRAVPTADLNTTFGLS